MKLHEYNEDFENLVSITASWRRIPTAAVWRDYYIVMMLQKLERSRCAHGAKRFARKRAMVA